MLVLPNSGTDMKHTESFENVVNAALPRYYFHAAADFKEHAVVQLPGADYGTRKICIGTTGRWLYAADIKRLQSMGVSERNATKPQTLACKKRVRNGSTETPSKRRKETCWFCLQNNIAAHLVLLRGASAYIAVAKGGVHEGHLLIIPKAHVRGWGCNGDG